jgi:hypothetical protein
MSDKKKHFYFKFLWAAGASLAVVCLVLLFWLIFPQPQVSYTGAGMRTTETIYNVGDPVTVIDDGTFCNGGVETVIERRVESAIGGTVLNPIYFFAPEQLVCIDNNSFVVSLPTEIPKGQWHIAIYTTYKANPVRSLTIERRSNTFTVTDTANIDRPTTLP